MLSPFTLNVARAKLTVSRSAVDMNFMGYLFNASPADSEASAAFQTLGPALPLNQEHTSFLAPPPSFSEIGSGVFDLAPSTTIQPAADSAPLPGSSLAPRPFVDLSDDPIPQTLSRKTGERLTRRGKPKPKEKDLDPAEDIPTTAANARMLCRWGSCTTEFRAGDWTAHFKTDYHRAEMSATQDAEGQVRCLWKGCTARMKPGSMGKHVRARHLGTYEFRCKHCGETARGDSYVGTHGRARDCPLRPGPSDEPSPATSASASTSPALSSSALSLSSRHSRRFSPYSRSTTSSGEPSEGQHDGKSHVLRLLAKVLGRRPNRRPLPQATSPKPPVAGPSLEAPPATLPILAPQPIRPVRVEAFHQFLSSSPVPEKPETAPTLPNPEPSSVPSHKSESTALCQPLVLEPAPADVSAAEMSLLDLIASIPDFDDLFFDNMGATS